MKLRISPNLALPEDTVTSTLIVYGGKGMGKTVLGAVMCEELEAARQRFSVIDPMGVFWGLRHSADGKGAGIEVLILGGKHGDMPIEPTGGAVVADLVADESISVIIDISRKPDGKMWSRGERIKFVADYCTRLYERQGERRRPLMQIIDEAGRYVPQEIRKDQPDIARCMGAVESLVEEARNVGVGVMLITQRSARMNKSVSELADAMFAFRTVGPRSVDAILDWFGEHVPKERWKELIEQLRKLPRGTALAVSPGWLEFEGQIPIRMRRTFDSSATPKAGKEQHASGPGAKPDLARYQERMAETIERAKADDPKTLRAHIAELEKELKKKAPAAAPGKVDPAAIERATVKGGMQMANQMAKEFRGVIVPARKAMAAAILGLRTVADHLEKALPAESLDFKATLDWKEEPPAPVQYAPPGNPRPRPVSPPRPARAAAEASDNGDLPRGERSILTACAQYPEGCTREQISVLVGLKRSTRDRYIQYLSQKGYVQAASGQNVEATPEGLAALGHFDPLPTGKELQEYWLRRLPEGESKMLRALIEAGARFPVDREYLGEAAGLQRSTRDRYLQYLAARKLIIPDGKGMVRASDTLF